MKFVVYCTAHKWGFSLKISLTNVKKLAEKSKFVHIHQIIPRGKPSVFVQFCLKSLSKCTVINKWRIFLKRSVAFLIKVKSYRNKHLTISQRAFLGFTSNLGLECRFWLIKGIYINKLRTLFKSISLGFLKGIIM